MAVSTVTFGSDNLAEFDTYAEPAGDGKYTAWYILNPTTQTANITVTYADNVIEAAGSATNWSNVSSSTPLDGWQEATATSTTPDVDVVSDAGDMVVDSIGGYNLTFSSWDAGQTQIANTEAAAECQFSSYEAGPGTIDMGCTITSTAWFAIGFNINHN